METAARGGGVYISSDLIHLSTGLCTEDFLLDIAEGIRTDLPELLPQQRVCGYMAFFIPRRDGEVSSWSGQGPGPALGPSKPAGPAETRVHGPGQHR